MTRTITRLCNLAVATSLVTLAAVFWTTAEASQAAKPTPPRAAAVTIDNFTFSAASLNVSVGTTVTWTNSDDVPHTVTSATKVFKSPPLDTGESFSYTFKTAGTFEYFCSLHPHMTGKIVVK